MELRHLRYFVAVADAGSFSAAASAAFVTQPTISSAIADLEHELSVRLFERRSRGVLLTVEGRRILAHARSVLEGARTIGLVASEETPTVLRIGVADTLVPTLVETVLKRITHHLQGMILRVSAGSAANLKMHLAAGRLDIALTSLPPKKLGYRQVVLAHDHQVLAFAHGSPNYGQVTPRILHRREIIVRTHCEHLQAASRILQRWGVRPVIAAKTNNDLFALSMASAGVGAVLIPSSFAAETVEMVQPQGVSLRRRLGLLWLKGGAGGVLDELAPRFEELSEERASA